MARKPDKGAEDPEEAMAVLLFKDNMGDYKLKTSSDYVVPKEQRVTLAKKRRKLLTLRKQVTNYHSSRASFTIIMSLSFVI